MGDVSATEATARQVKDYRNCKKLTEASYKAQAAVGLFPPTLVQPTAQKVCAAIHPQGAELARKLDDKG